MRALEPKLFGSSMLLKAGHPRLWFFISAASTAGFVSLIFHSFDILSSVNTFWLSRSVPRVPLCIQCTCPLESVMWMRYRFAIRGEKKLFRATRSYHVSGSAN